MPQPKSLQDRQEWIKRIRLQAESGANVPTWIPDFCQIHFLMHRLRREKQDKRDCRSLEGARRKLKLLLPDIRQEFFQPIRRMLHKSAKQIFQVDARVNVQSPAGLHKR